MPDQMHEEVEPPKRLDDYEGQARAKSTRLSILKHAAQLFSSKGYDGCSTREIATAAGVSYANIRYHFGDKDTLWRKVIVFLQTEAYQGNELLSKMDGGEEAKHLFRSHTYNAVQYIADRPELPRIFLFERLAGGPRLAEIEPIIEEIHLDRVRHIERMQAAGAIRSDIDPERLNALIAGGLTEKFVVQPVTDQKTRNRLIDEFTDMIVRLVAN
ncbi:MAG: TetR/AcrR family transcriptional regulator [Pseudomonadota bacterium]